MKDLLRCLRQPPFGTETSERDIMSAAADEIEQLRARAERAENGLEQIADVWEIMWRGKHKEASADWIVPDMLAYVKDKDKELDDYLSRAERAEAALKEAVEALKPFGASLADNYSHQPALFTIVAGGGMYDLRFRWTLGELRRARAVLEKIKGE